MSKRTVTVVLPTYNESGNIVEEIERIEAALGGNLLEIVIVDDDSPDLTWKIVEDRNDPLCRVIHRTTERGLASALARGTREARGDAIVWMDCDLGMPPEAIPSLVTALDHYDIAVGSRYVPGGKDERPAFRTFLSYAFNIYTRLILWKPFWDWTSGFAAVRREAMEQVPLSDKGYGEYFTEWIYVSFNRGLRITEVPYHYGVRKHGESKTDADLLHFLTLAFQYAFRVIQIRFRP